MIGGIHDGSKYETEETGGGDAIAMAAIKNRVAVLAPIGALMVAGQAPHPSLYESV